VTHVKAGLTRFDIIKDFMDLRRKEKQHETLYSCHYACIHTNKVLYKIHTSKILYKIQRREALGIIKEEAYRKVHKKTKGPTKQKL